MNKLYEINVISDDHFDNLVAELTFKGKFLSAIISQEKNREDFEISVFSHIENAKERFYNTEKIESITIDINLFQSAIEEAKIRLKLLDEKKE